MQLLYQKMAVPYLALWAVGFLQHANSLGVSLGCTCQTWPTKLRDDSSPIADEVIDVAGR